MDFIEAIATYHNSEVDVQLALDRYLFGTSFCYLDSTGLKHRIDPLSVQHVINNRSRKVIGYKIVNTKGEQIDYYDSDKLTVE